MRVLLTGSSGQLGGYVLQELARAELEVVAWSGARTGRLDGVPFEPVDLGDVTAVETAFDRARPDLVIHAGAISSVGECHRSPERAGRVNTAATALVAERTARAGGRFVFVSTDLVFDGEKGFYREHDPPSPLSTYGRSKLLAEEAVRVIPRTAIVRLSLLYGPPRVRDRPSFFNQQIAAIRARRAVALFEDEWRTPLDLATAARALIEVARSDHAGLLHVGGPERLSRLELGRRVATCLGLDASVIVAASRAGAPFAEPRPRDTSLDSSRWRELFPNQPWPTVEQALPELMAQASGTL